MENIRGAAFMVLAMFCFAVEDALIKNLASDIPPGQILAFICAGGLACFLPLFVVRGMPLWQPEYLHPKVILRSLSEVVGSCMFVTALALIPLTTASAVIQATPLVVAMGAGLFLGQAIGWRRWIAISVGFVGVMIIIRPGLEGFQPATLFAVGGMLGLASRDLLTRSMNVKLNGMQLGTHAYVLLLPAGLILTYVQGQSFVMPNADEWLLLLAAAIVGMFAYLTIITATRTGNAGIISSFRYSRMVFALVIGFVFFAETPDAATLTGAAIIITSGIYTLWREARLHRASLALKPAL